MSVKLKSQFLRGIFPWKNSKTFHGKLLAIGCRYIRRLIEKMKSLLVERRLSQNRCTIGNDLICDINRFEATLYSQCGEDGILDAIFYKIGTTNKFFVEFGVQDGIECNTRFLQEKRRWSGLLMDGGDNNPTFIKKEFITVENINVLFKKYDVPYEFDLLSIDIDGNDYWVWKEIQESYSPRVVVIEYNAAIPPTESKTIEYISDFRWDGTNYFGASLLALDKLAKQKGYTLVGCNEIGGNAFFVRNDIIKGNFIITDIGEMYKPPIWTKDGNIGHPPSDKKMVEV